MLLEFNLVLLETAEKLLNYFKSVLNKNNLY